MKGVEPVSFAYTSPSSGTSGPYQPSFRDDLLQSWLLIPLVVFLVLALIALAIRSFWSLRNNKRLVQRLGDFVTLPAEENAAQRRKEVDVLLAAAGQDKQRRRNWRWMDGFSEDVDVAQIKRDPQRMVFMSVLAGLVVAVLGAVAISPFWVDSRSRPADRAEPVRAREGTQGAERLRRAASREPRRARLRASGRPQPRRAPWALSPTRRRSRRSGSTVASSLDEQLGIPLDEALEVTAKRMQNPDIDQVAVLALVQREAGGNTAEVLDQVTKNIRARMDIRRLVTVLTAQGKFSSVVVAWSRSGSSSS